MDNWGTRLMFVIRRKKLTQKAIAASIGVSANAVNKWTAGCDIDIENLQKLAKYLQVNWVWLRHGNEALASAMDAGPGVGDEVGFAGESSSRQAVRDIRLHTAVCSAAEIGAWSYHIEKNQFCYSEVAQAMLGMPNDVTTIQVTRDRVWTRVMPSDVLPEGTLVNDFFVLKKPFAVYPFRLRRDPTRWLSQLAVPVKRPDGEVESIAGLICYADNPILKALCAKTCCCINRVADAARHACAMTFMLPAINSELMMLSTA